MLKLNRNQYRGRNNRKTRKELHSERANHEREKMESMFNEGIKIHTWENKITDEAHGYILAEFKLKKSIKYNEFLALLISSVLNGELKEYVC